MKLDDVGFEAGEGRAHIEWQPSHCPPVLASPAHKRKRHAIETISNPVIKVAASAVQRDDGRIITVLTLNQKHGIDAGLLQAAVKIV
jgi:hypothetical protein